MYSFGWFISFLYMKIYTNVRCIFFRSDWLSWGPTNILPCQSEGPAFQLEKKINCSSTCCSTCICSNSKMITIIILKFRSIILHCTLFSIWFYNTLCSRVVPNCVMKAKNVKTRVFIADQIDDCKDLSGIYYLLPFQKVSLYWGGIKWKDP